ncbi:MAG: isoprenylcysteine carboxylmethyltransferase family protein [Pseudomonadota bacterium]
MKLLVPPPIYALVCAFAIWLLNQYFPTFEYRFSVQTLLASLLIILGVSMDLLSIRRFFKIGTTVSPVSPQNTEALVTEGVYSISRNPMYLGLLFILTGIAIWAGNLLGLLTIPVFVFLITKFQIIPEEEILLEKFGEVYGNYLMKVRRWI